MKGLFFLVSIILASTLYAQQGLGKSANNSNIPVVSSGSVKYFKERLSLTSDQVDKIGLIEQKYMEGRLTISSSLSSKERTLEIQKLENIKNDEMQKIFTPEQYKKYLEIMEERLRQFQAKQKQLRERNKNQ